MASRVLVCILLYLAVEKFASSHASNLTSFKGDEIPFPTMKAVIFNPLSAFTDGRMEEIDQEFGSVNAVLRSGAQRYFGAAD